MQCTNTFSLLFWAYTSRAKNDQVPIYVRVTVNGQKANIALKHRADIGTWDPQRQRAKGSGEASRTLNRYLDRVRSQLVQFHDDLTFKKQLVTADLIKAHFLGDTEEFKTLEDLLAYHTKKTEKVLATGTLRNFGVTQRYLLKFLKDKRKTSNIFLKELNYQFICDLETYLHGYWPKGHPKAMGNNTVMKHIQRFRKMVTLAYHLEWLERDPFVRWKPAYEKRHREYLSELELDQLESYHFPIDRLDRVRDLFVFSCYTGISYADIIKLDTSNIQIGTDGGEWIVTERQKTKEPVKIPLLPKAQALIDKYTGHPITSVSRTLLPVITNEKLNLYLKEIAEACGIEKNLTFHMARHTFATTVTLSNGVPIETVSKLLGHTKIATTQIYARVIERKVGEDMEVLRQKLK